MKKTFINFRFKLLTVALLLIALSCEKDNETDNVQIIEQGNIEYGISQNDFESSKAFDGILSTLNSNNGTISNGKNGTTSQLTSVELLERLDLSKGYIHLHDDGKELLSIPVRTNGNYKRVLLSLTRNDFTNSFLLTYPDSTNNKLYYVSSLDGILLQKVTIQDDGVGITETFNSIENNSDTASKSSNSGCTETVYEACSPSGSHSFANGNAMECTYWTDLGSGTPPTVATIDVGCSGGSGGSSGGGSSGGGTSGGGTSTGGGGFNGGDGDGFSGVPPVKGGGSLVGPDDCVANLDCDECNLGPHDIDGDCNLTTLEININSINNCLGGTLTGTQKNFLFNNPHIATNAYNSMGIICNPNVIEYFNEVIDILEDGDEVDFVKEIIIDGSIPDCVKNIINNLIDDDSFLDLGDMTDEIKQELNLSGFILELFNNSDSFQLTFKAEDIPPNTDGDIVNAKTDRGPVSGSPGNFFIDITLNNSYITNATDIAIARTIIHESLHAYIVYTYQTNIFSDLSQAFMVLLTEAGMPENDNPAQHQLMVDNFISAIANSLENWDESSIPDSNYYDYISWSGGLTSTSTFNSKPLIFRQNVINANIAEGQADTAYNSTTAKGSKNCN